MKTFEEIESMGMHDPVIRRCLEFHYRGEITREQALIEMVVALAEQKNHYYNEVVRLHQNSTTPSIRP